jgi:F-type H+-transporting ATPase subunit gamma
VGRKGYTYLARLGRDVARYFAEPPLERIDFTSARLLARALVDAFLGGEVSEMHGFSTRFLSMVSTPIVDRRLLPIEVSSLLGEEARGFKEGDTIFEPDPGEIFRSLVPRTLETAIYQLLLEGLTAEYAARRISMKNATEAAEEMRGELGRRYNRARQEKITKELLEIASGAEALRAG